MEPLYKNVCRNCEYLLGGFTTNASPHCAKYPIYIRGDNTDKVYCDKFEMEHNKKQRQMEYDKIVNKLIVMDIKELRNFIVTNLDYDDENDEWIAHI